MGADLEATVEESDGQRQVFRVPYTSLPDMIRPGAMRYSVAAGKYRSQGRDVKEPVVFSGGLERGFEYFTLGGALLASDRYQTLSAGVSGMPGISVLSPLRLHMPATTILKTRTTPATVRRYGSSMPAILKHRIPRCRSSATSIVQKIFLSSVNI